jgi:hypothetical protein
MQINMGDNTTLEAIGMRDMEVTMTMEGRTLAMFLKMFCTLLRLPRIFFW